MGCWYGPTPGRAADGACGRCRRMKKKTIAAAAMEMAATPPTTPPAMAPTFVLLPVCVGAGVPEENLSGTVLCGDTGPVADAETVAPEASTAPGASSGESVKKKKLRLD